MITDDFPSRRGAGSNDLIQILPSLCCHVHKSLTHCDAQPQDSIHTDYAPHTVHHKV